MCEVEGFEEVGFFVDVGSKIYCFDGCCLVVILFFDFVIWGGKIFCGGFDVFFNDCGKFNLINCVDFEDYFCGVVLKEFGLVQYLYFEVFKVQVVVVCMYIMCNFGEFFFEGYDICVMLCCQVYGGWVFEYLLSDCVICEMWGQVLFYCGVLVEIFYLVICGGYIEDVNVVFLVKDYEYLCGVLCIELGWQVGVLSDLVFVMCLMLEVLLLLQIDLVWCFEDCLCNFVVCVGLFMFEDCFEFFEVWEVRCFVVLIFDFVVDVWIFVDLVELCELVEELFFVWSGED